MSEHPAHVSGRTILTTTNRIAAPSSWLLYVYEVLKALNFILASGVSEFLIYRLRILDLMRC